MLSGATVIALPRTMNNLRAHPELNRAFCNAPHPVYLPRYGTGGVQSTR